MFPCDHAGRRIDQALTDDHCFYPFFEHFPDPLQQRSVLVVHLLLCALVVRLGQSQLTAPNILKSLALELGQVIDDPRIDAVIEQNDFNAFFSKLFDMWTGSAGREILCDDVIDFVLLCPGAFNVVCE